MVGEITERRRRSPWRGPVLALIIAAGIVAIGLIVLGLTGDFLVDWLWFSALGYQDVFWTTIAAEAAVFCAVFLATAVILWLNGSLAFRFARAPWTPRRAWQRAGVVTLSDTLHVLRKRLPWPAVIASGAGLLALLVAWGELYNWVRAG